LGSHCPLGIRTARPCALLVVHALARLVAVGFGHPVANIA
jgi:hypothetical protein